MKKIIFATDFLESSRLALDYAVAFAHHYRANLTILHVFELPPEAEEVEMRSHQPSISREHALVRLQSFASGVRRLAVDTEIDLRAGEPCATILGAAAESEANLLVLGTHGVYRGVQHVLLGSNAENILLAASCPTLTVGRHVMAGIDLDLNFRRILFISDLSQESETAAKYANSIGQSLGIPVELLNVLEEDKVSHTVQAAVENYCAGLHHQSAFSSHPWCNPEFHFKRFVSAKNCIQRAMIFNDGLLVLGVRKESGWKRHLHASFAFELVATSGSPVLSIHSEGSKGASF